LGIKEYVTAGYCGRDKEPQSLQGGRRIWRCGLFPSLPLIPGRVETGTPAQPKPIIKPNALHPRHPILLANQGSHDYNPAPQKNFCLFLL